MKNTINTEKNKNNLKYNYKNKLKTLALASILSFQTTLNTPIEAKTTNKINTKNTEIIDFNIKNIKNEKENPIQDEDFKNKDKLTLLFLNEIKKRNNPDINQEEFKKFIKNIIQNKPDDENFNALITARYEDILLQGKTKTQQINTTKTLISSIKSYQNNKNDYFFDFNEEETKKNIIKNYITPSKETISDIDGLIKTLYIYTTNGVEEETKNIINKICETKQGEDFSIGILYEEKKILEKTLKNINPEYHKYIKPILTREGYRSILNDPRIRDGAKITKNGDIIQSKQTYLPDTKSIYSNIANQEGKNIIQSNLIFQGGNILSTNNDIYIGYNDILANIINDTRFLKEQATNINYDQNLITQEKIEKIVGEFEKKFNKKVNIVGIPKENGIYKIPETKQYIYHIDMFFTPINDNQILLGSLPNTKENTIINQWLEDISIQFKNEGKEIIRIPMLSFQKIRNNEGLYQIYSYNNMLIENQGETKRIYLPSYQKQKTKNTEKIVATTLEELGYKVIKIPINELTIRESGSLHCRTLETRTH